MEGAAAPVSFGEGVFLMLFAVMCCKIPLSACFEYSRNISLSCSSHSVLFFLSFSTLFFLQHSFSYFFGMRRGWGRGGRGGKAVRGILSKLTQLIYMFPTVRSSLHQHSCIYVCVCMHVCVCVCMDFLHSFL